MQGNFILGFEILTAVNLGFMVFRVMKSWGLVGIHVQEQTNVIDNSTLFKVGLRKIAVG
jgi:hypothetical protein